jgi:putative ABC transport system permease protein
VTLATLMQRNLWRQPRRTFVTALSIAVSGFLLTTLLALVINIHAIGHGDRSLHLRLVTHRATSLTEDMPAAYKEQIASVPGVKYVTSVSWFNHRVEGNFFEAFAVDAPHFADVVDEYRIPPNQVSTWQRERTGALIGKKLMAERHWQVGQHITLKGTGNPVNPELLICAVYEDPTHGDEERTLYFHYDYLNELAGNRSRVQNFLIKASSAQDIPHIPAAVDSMFRNSAAETQTETEEAYELNFLSMLGDFVLLVVIICAIVAFNVLLVTGNTLAMSIRERRTEIAVMRTLGFNGSHVLMVVLGESLFLAVTAGLVGCFGAKLTFHFVETTYSLGSQYAWSFGGAVGILLGLWALYCFSIAEPKMDGRHSGKFGLPVILAVCGFIIGWLLYTGVGNLLVSNNVLSGFQISSAAVLLALGISVALDLLSACWPAIWASLTPISGNLRTAD